MIFNSISRELNQNQYSRKQYLQKNSQGSYFPQKHYASTNIFENIPEATYPRQKNESALAKMNNKISQNIEYLRYKDKLRANQLRSSRVSNSSNRSNRSHHSNKSLKSYNQSTSSYYPARNNGASDIRTYLPSQQSKVKTFAPPQSYYNEEKTSKDNQNYWKQQTLSNNYERKFANDEFKYFTRNPITITNNSYPTEFGQPERDVNQSLQRSKHSNSSQIYELANSQKSKENTMQTEYPKHTTPLQWNASFGSSMRNSKLTPIHDRQAPQQVNQSPKREEIPKVGATDSLSPLAKNLPTSKNGLIISAGLIVLGVLILLLQILK